MTARSHRRTAVLTLLAMCAVASIGDAGPASAAPSSGEVRLSIPRPTGPHPVGVRSTFLHDPGRTEPTTGGPRAIPVRVWYPAEERHGPSGPYFSPAVQPVVEQGTGAPSGLFDVDTHATVDAPARRRVSGVLLFTGGFGVPVALYTGLIVDLASHGYVVVAFDHPHETFAVEQPGGSVISMDLADDAGPGRDCATSPSACPVFEARLGDIAVVLGALGDLVAQAPSRTPIGIFGHSNGGAAAAVAIRRHPQIRAGVNLDGFIPAELVAVGLDRPFGLMTGLDQRPEELRDVEVFLSNMRAPHRERTLDIRHYGFSDFVVFNPQALRADPALGMAFEANYPAGTANSIRAGRRALRHQRQFVLGFFDRFLGDDDDDGDDGDDD